MHLDGIGYNHRHNGDFIIDRPYGTDNWLLLFTHTPAEFHINGTTIISEPGSFILYTPGTPHYYKVVGESYADDWIHFRPNKEETDMINKLNIPFNTLIKLSSISEPSLLVHTLTYEYYTANVYENEICELYMKLILYKLSGILKADNIVNDASAKYHDRLVKLRNDIYCSPQVKREIDDMAESVFMSRSSLQHSYKKAFGVCLSEDIINSRLNRAKFYLSTTNMSISEIAYRCGFNSDVYFMRRFKKAFSQTPTKFRSSL